MTDYWISCKKHYCEVCKVWISGHPLNIKTHETTPKHLTAVRNAIIDSHKREKEKQKAEAFEKEELERLENIVNNDNHHDLNPIIDDLPPKPIIPPLIPLGPSRHEEERRLAEFYASKLKDTNKPTNGSIPSNLLQVEKQLELELGPEWKKKYDPIRKIKYFHNEKTGGVKLVNENIIKSKDNEDDVVTTNIISTNIKKDEKPKSKPMITISIKSKIESSDKNEENIKNESQAPIIGAWEVVTDQSAFNLPVYTESIQELPEENSDDLSDPLEEATSKPIFINSKNKNGITFAKRDISAIKRPKR